MYPYLLQVIDWMKTPKTLPDIPSFPQWHTSCKVHKMSATLRGSSRDISRAELEAPTHVSRDKVREEPRDTPEPTERQSVTKKPSTFIIKPVTQEEEAPLSKYNHDKVSQIKQSRRPEEEQEISSNRGFSRESHSMRPPPHESQRDQPMRHETRPMSPTERERNVIELMEKKQGDKAASPGGVHSSSSGSESNVKPEAKNVSEMKKTPTESNKQKIFSQSRSRSGAEMKKVPLLTVMTGFIVYSLIMEI